ncbi:MAG: hypothetical protein KGJ43_01085 [Acidobacteriota bacterium]|nr:hypothetical protein [Acidobacteriota bacterium]
MSLTVRPAAPRERPAFYALAPGGWRDLITLLHPPYTAWHLSYVAIGAAVAPTIHGWRLAAAIGAFFLAVGVSAHALDERLSRPLGTGISDRTLVALAAIALGGAVGIGILGAVTVSLTIVPFIVVGTFMVIAYDLELWGGRFHSDLWFATAWGAFPAFTGYWADALHLSAQGILVAVACALLSAAQRSLSTPVRVLRRRTLALSGEQTLADGATVSVDARSIAAPMEGALRAMAAAMVMLAAALVAARA